MKRDEITSALAQNGKSSTGEATTLPTVTILKGAKGESFLSLELMAEMETKAQHEGRIVDEFNEVELRRKQVKVEANMICEEIQARILLRER